MTEPNGYFLFDGSFISVSELSKADRETQLEANLLPDAMVSSVPAEIATSEVEG